MKRLMLPLLLVLASAAGAQQPPPLPAPVQPAPAPAAAPSERMPVIPVEQMMLEYLPAPENAPNGLLGAVMKLYRRVISVRNADGSITGPLPNVDDVGNSFVIYDSADYVAAVKAAVARTVATLPAAQMAAPRVATYAPRNVNVNRLAEALDPLRRKVLVPGPPGFSSEVRQNLSFQLSPALMTLQDTPEHVERMLAMLAEVDQPPPQFLIEVLVLAESSADADDTSLPSELLENLHRLLPIRAFTQLATAIVRASVQPGEEHSLEGQLSTGENFQLRLLPGGVDLPNHRLSLERLRFEAAGQSFETSTVVDLGGYTVIGGVGSDPRLVVLRVSNLSGK
jgi:hypothetical protein